MTGFEVVLGALCISVIVVVGGSMLCHAVWRTCPLCILAVPTLGALAEAGLITPRNDKGGAE